MATQTITENFTTPVTRTRTVTDRSTDAEGQVQTTTRTETFTVQENRTRTYTISIPDPLPQNLLPENQLTDPSLDPVLQTATPTDDLDAMSPAELAETFADDPAAMETYLATLDAPGRHGVMADFNEAQAAGDLTPAQLAGVDAAYTHLQLEYATREPTLNSELSEYAANNVDRPEFVQAAVLDPLAAGDTSDAMRDYMHRLFSSLDMDQSHTVMQSIRDAGLQDTFLDAVLRDASGDPVDPAMHEAIATMLDTGRLDIYAETLASTTFNTHDGSTRTTNPHFNPSEDAIYFTEAAMAGDVDALARTMAHEVFHAFQADHGGVYGAMNEGYGIAVIHYAFTDDDYSIAEAVYGTDNYYRDYLSDEGYPLGTMSGADDKLLELIEAMAPRDSSQIQWQDDAALLEDYETFWEPIDRTDPDWVNLAVQAEADMLAAR